MKVLTVGSRLGSFTYLNKHRIVEIDPATNAVWTTGGRHSRSIRISTGLRRSRMAIVWLDGFDNYGTSVGKHASPAWVITRKYGKLRTKINECGSASGRFGQYGFNLHGCGLAI